MQTNASNQSRDENPLPDHVAIQRAKNGGYVVGIIGDYDRLPKHIAALSTAEDLIAFLSQALGVDQRPPPTPPKTGRGGRRLHFSVRALNGSKGSCTFGLPLGPIDVEDLAGDAHEVLAKAVAGFGDGLVTLFHGDDSVPESVGFEFISSNETYTREQIINALRRFDHTDDAE